MATFAELNAIAQTACDAWSHALQAAYGKKAGDARYDKRGWSTPELKALRDACCAASDARHSAWVGLTNHERELFNAAWQSRRDSARLS